MKALLPLFIATALGAVAAPAAHADTNDNWVVRFGAHVVDPKSNNGTLAGARASVDSSVRPSASLEYMITPNLGVDVLAAWPFEHDVRLSGLGKVAQTKQLPPTVGLNYHFMPNNTWSPFLGLGVNYTNFFDTKGAGALQGSSVSIANSWGVAAHAGIDVTINPKWIVTADLRWINIKSDVKVGGTKVGTATINPMVYGISLGYRF
ncbi:OmpW/AlkL family protein [Dyella humicola]|uniref:OmpW/AlkL family protein n=1 Tax=Dyella humicola TaxID=2992126 RepID=UPI002252A12B|nr:OmpW family outer membrane protein [Dyella humicola]